MKKYLPIFFFFLILNHAQSQFSSGTSTWSSGTYFSLGSGTNASGSGAIAFGLSTSAYQGAVGLGYANYAYYTGAVAIGYDNYSYGYGATSLGYDNAAQSNYTTAIGYSNYVSSANGGVAIGYDNDTRAYYAISIGYSNYVNGTGAAALGYDHTVSGAYSVALGRSNSTSGVYSTAMGYDTTASDYASTVIGQYNSSGSSATSSSSFSTSAPAFVIGNGTSSGSLSDAFKVMFNGDAYISSSLYLGGTAVTSTAAEINYVDGVTSNVQTQLDSKQATITGAATTIASSDLTASRALISNSSGKVEVSDVTSTELGYLDGVSSAVQTQLNSKQATLTGAATTISFNNLSVSRALTSNASGKVEVSAVTSTELGYLDGVTSPVQTQLDSKLSSSGNITTGGNIIIPDSGTVGSSTDNDAMTIASNGNVTFSQDLTVSGDITVSSDQRLKSNIKSLGSTISKLMQIDGKTYTTRNNGKEKIGILAQEVRKVFPELVSEDDNEMLAVNYQGLVPVLINALKEQDEKINRLEILVETLIKNQ